MKKDLTTKVLMEYPDVFADIGNVCLFGGRKYIRPEDLELCPQEIFYKETDGQLHEHRGDVRMRLKEKGVEVAILHVENQSEASNVMPLRDLGYIYSGYQAQLRDLKAENRKEGIYYAAKEVGDDQKFRPVISLILYYGTEEWAGPTHLKDMLDIPDDEKELWEGMVEDHKIHLVDLSRQSDEEVSWYESDLWYIVKCLKCGKNKERFRDFLEEGANRRMQHPEAVIDMITAFAGKTQARKLADQIICEQKEKGDDCTMYSFLDYFEEVGLEKGMQKGMQRGMEKGMKEGREKGIEEGQEKLYYKMFSKDHTPEDISEFTGESLEYLYDLKEKYLATVREEGQYGSKKEIGNLPEDY